MDRDTREGLIYIGQEPIELDARDLRNAAEAISSLRGREQGDRYFIVQHGPPGKGELIPRHGNAGDTPPDGTLFQLDTRARQPHRLGVSQVTIKPKGGCAHVLEGCDAVFWSESAVEKFLFPYYASKGMWRAAQLLTALSESWYKTRETDPEKIPFAIAHLPDSQYTDLEEGMDLTFFFKERCGCVSAKSLGQVIKDREAGDHGTAGPATQTPAAPDGA